MLKKDEDVERSSFFLGRKQPCPVSGQHNLSGLYLAGDTEPCQQFGFNRIGLACHRSALQRLHYTAAKQCFPSIAVESISKLRN
jgi:hypothetical protein